MATEIERLEESLRKAKEKADIRNLNNISNRIEKVLIILGAHTFQPHRKNEIENLESLITNVRNKIFGAKSKKEDNPATGSE